MILGYVRRTESDADVLSSSQLVEEDSLMAVDPCTTLSGLSLPRTKQLPLPFGDEQLCILRFRNGENGELGHGEGERRRSGIWRRGKVLYVDFGSGGECA